MAGIVELRNCVQDYAWGSTTHISRLLGTDNREGGPQAELWMGAHKRAPSRVRDLEAGADISLIDWIERDPAGILGPSVAAQYDEELPFLFKVLAAARPLSLQAHPSSEQARAGFAREDAAGISQDAATRNYRDARHKPELICALTAFDAMLGFRAPGEIASGLDGTEGHKEAAIHCRSPRPY